MESYFNLDKVLVSVEKMNKIKESEGVIKIEYQTDTTKLIAYKLDGKLYIEDFIQL